MIINSRCYIDDNGNLCAGPEKLEAEAPLLNLDEIIVQEIFTLHDFRDWWRVMTGTHSAQFRYKMTRAEWEASVRTFKKLKEQNEQRNPM